MEIKINIDKKIKKNSTILSSKEYQYILEKFKKHGMINFSNISSNIKNLVKFVDLFTKNYSNDAKRRKIRFNQSKLRNVDIGLIGLKEVKLHSETSFSPSRPEIVWFYCIKPPKTNSGKTLICDGITLWNILSAETKFFFLGEPVYYSLRIPIENNIKGKGKKKWYLDSPGVKNCYLNYDNNSIEFEYIKFAVQESLYENKLCFSNHLIVTLNSELQMLSRKMYSGEKIPKRIMTEIIQKSKSITHEITWKKNDLLMLDNLRFMHGRQAISSKEIGRDIITMQTLKSSFNLKN